MPHTHAPAGSAAVLACGRMLQRRVALTGLKPRARVRCEFLDHTSGHALSAWQEMGCPEPPDRARTARLKETASTLRVELHRASSNGTLELDVDLTPR